MRKAFVRGMLSGICALALTSTASAAEATLNAYEARASAQNLQTLAENGFDTSEGFLRALQAVQRVHGHRLHTAVDTPDEPGEHGARTDLHERRSAAA